MSNRVVGRWDHFVKVRMDDDETILNVPVFRLYDGTVETIILTERDIAKTTAATYQCLTPTYTTGQVTAIETVTGPLYRVTVNTDLTTSGIEVGDKWGTPAKGQRADHHGAGLWKTRSRADH